MPVLALFLLTILAGHALAGLQPCDFHNPVERDGDTALLLQCVTTPETTCDELLLIPQKQAPRSGRCRSRRHGGIVEAIFSWIKIKLASTWAFVCSLASLFQPPTCTDVVVRQTSDLQRQHTDLLVIAPPGCLQKVGNRSLMPQCLELLDPKMRVIWLETRRCVKLMQMMMM